MKPILLATTSKYKRELFEKLGLAFEMAAPPYEEQVVEGVEPADLASMLATGKAQSLGQTWPDHLIIGADQVLALGQQVFTKPETTERAVAQLLSLSGQTHSLHTAFSLWDPARQKLVSRVVSSQLTFHPRLSPDFLRRMVEEDHSQDCVGAYKFESRGIFLFEKVESSDINAIIGLPLLAMIEELSRFGYFPIAFYKGRHY